MARPPSPTSSGCRPGGALLAAYCQLSHLLLAAEDPKAAGEWSERASALAAAIDRVDATVLTMLTAGWIEMFNGRRKRAGEARAGRRAAGEAGHHAAAVGAEVAIARTAGRLRWWDVADDHLRAGLEICDGRDFDVWRYYLISWRRSWRWPVGTGTRLQPTRRSP